MSSFQTQVQKKSVCFLFHKIKYKNICNCVTRFKYLDKHFESASYFTKTRFKRIETNRHESAARDRDADGKEAADFARHPARQDDPQNQRRQVAGHAAVTSNIYYIQIKYLTFKCFS